MSIWDTSDKILRNQSLEDFLKRFDSADDGVKNDFISMLVNRAKDNIYMTSILADAYVDSGCCSGAFVLVYNSSTYPIEVKILGSMPKGYELKIKSAEE